MKEQFIRLKDRLNDLSKRNRSIRLLKLYNKWNFDLASLDELKETNHDDAQASSRGQQANLAKHVLEGIRKGNKGVQLLKRRQGNEAAEKMSHRLTTLERNLRAIEDETGLYDLYVGYPFLSGVMSDGTYFRAPLLLYPVRLTLQKNPPQQWLLEKQEDGEPLLNRPLFLALKKFHHLLVDDAIYDEASDHAEGDLAALQSWLEQHHIEVKLPNSGTLQPFPSYTQAELPDLAKGTIQMDPLAVLGHFPQGDSAIARDYEQLIEQFASGDYEALGLVERLLDGGRDDRDKFSNDSSGLSEAGSEELLSAGESLREKDQVLLLDADASQEAIVRDIRKKEGLVVHGPPGTGKSQVIVNLITDALARGERVMIVCQKRAALDVVYQRLDALGLSSHAALVHNENTDRKTLYAKMKHQLQQSPNHISASENDLEKLSDRIEKRTQDLDAIAKGLYEVQDNGYRAFDLYTMARRFDDLTSMVPLSAVLSELHKDNLKDILSVVSTYAAYYERFGQQKYPLKQRRSFAELQMKDRVFLTETLEKAMQEAKETAVYLEKLEEQSISPEYSWQTKGKLKKIYNDLDSGPLRTLQKLKLWWWTSFAGKAIIKEMLNGQPFPGLASKEWPILKERLRNLYELSQISEQMTQSLRKLNSYLLDDSVKQFIDQTVKGELPQQKLRAQFEALHRDFDDLRRMDQIYEEAKQVVRELIDLQKDHYEERLLRNLSQQWADDIKQSAFSLWIDEIERKQPALLKVSSGEYEQIVKSFKELLAEKQVLGQQVLVGQLRQGVDQALKQFPKALKELRYQVGKKRSIWPLRKLVREFSETGLLELLPVWLVSPETLSNIFPLKKHLFDLLIFDEASQLTVESGIPALLRAKRVVVAGDEKQLPPMNLFRVTDEADEEAEEIYATEEAESFLNLSKRRYPGHLLQWHYRSKYEELINFSNHAFYDGYVQVAPNVEYRKDPAPILWHRVQGRWVNQCNEVEAIAVVELLKQQLIEHANRSVGIITFNMKQQEKIMDLIDRKTEEDPEFDAVYQQVMGREFDERVFVKNIENVQGDERDTIIFSIGYAPNEEGRVYNRFGQLNQQGGENRLNVAITRAKEQIHVVSSIEPHELNVSGAKNLGPKLFQLYLKYAKAISERDKDAVGQVIQEVNDLVNQSVSKRALNPQFDSDFEVQVYERIREMGYDVETQVGFSGYRIDLAVVHPNEPNRYILGIECDGAAYHSSQSAKERDVYRQRFLESKGWTIHRIWSRNWWKDADAELEKIDLLIRRMILLEQKKTAYEAKSVSGV